jgi:hypothetical protein
MTRQTNAVERLRQTVHAEWPGIKRSRELAEKVRTNLQALLDGLIPTDTSFVVFGSLGRDEWTAGSDLDWTLLIDGPADPEHLNVSQKIRAVLDGQFKQPGRTGIFGDVAFSHEIIHQIGGQADTNRNTTQRILLLLESTPIGDAAAYSRVINGLLSRYVSEDTSFLTQDGRAYKVP